MSKKIYKGSNIIAGGDGRSAYQVWLDQGHVGTESDFLAALKGDKGDTGVSADYPITIYNGLDSTATDEALAANQGKALDEKIGQLGQEIYDNTTTSLTPTNTGSNIPKSDGTTHSGGGTWKRHDYDVANIEDVITVTTDATPAGTPTQNVDCVYYLLKDANSNVLLAGTDIHSANPSPFQINLANYPGASVLQVTISADTLTSTVVYGEKTRRYILVEDVVNNLTSDDEKDPLSAKQGKVLGEAVSGKISTSDIEDSLTSSSSNKVLSAKQGKVLNDRIDNELFDEEIVTLTPPTSYGSSIPKADGTTRSGGGTWERADYTVSGINKVITITTDAPKSTNASQFVGCVYYILKDASANVLAVGPDLHENNPSPATLDLSLYPAAATLQITTDGTNKQTSVSYVDVEPKYIPSDNIVDDLLSSDSTKPLSAKQGKILNEKIENNSGSVSIAIPPVIEVVGKSSSIYGNRLQIYYRDIIGAVDPFKYSIKPICTGGQIKHRYFGYDAKDKGADNIAFTLQVRNDKNILVAEKETVIKIIAPPSSPASNLNILLLGSSTLGTGTVAKELKRRLCETSGSNDTYRSEPKGLGLSNITFVGRRVGSRYDQVLQESAGGAGYSKKYAIDSGNQIRFYVSSGNVEVGDVYSDGATNYTIVEDNVAISGGGNFLCAEGTDPVSQAGTLTKISGGGDASITYTSYYKESGNPFWDRTLSTPGLNFQMYANNYCNGQIDMIVSLMTGNDLSYLQGDITTLLNSYIKPFVRKYHTDFPNGKFIFGIQPPYSIYGDSVLTYDMKLWTIQYANALYEMAEDPEFSPYFSIAHTLQLFDNENMFPLHDEPVANRLPDVMEKETINGTHPTGAGGQFQVGQDEAGCLTLADGLYYAVCAVL